MLHHRYNSFLLLFLLLSLTAVPVTFAVQPTTTQYLEPVSSTTSSCVGVRSTYIDREYCQAAYPDTTLFCDDEDEDDCSNNVIYTTASCPSICERAGCECGFIHSSAAGGSNCTDQSSSCSTTATTVVVVTCQPPEEEPVYVGSCVFFTNQEACESVNGCSWAPNTMDEVSGVAVMTETDSSTQWNVLGLIVVILGACAGSLVVMALIFCLCWKYHHTTAAAAKNENTKSIPTAAPVNETPVVPVVPAIVLDPEDPSTYTDK